MICRVCEIEQLHIHTFKAKKKKKNDYIIKRSYYNLSKTVALRFDDKVKKKKLIFITRKFVES